LPLHEPQRKPVALADLAIPLAVLVLQPVGWRQRPDAGRMILGVGGIGIDFGTAVEPEAGFFDQGDGHVFADIAVAGLRLLRQVRAAAVPDDAEYAAGLERAMKGAQCARQFVL